jgi:hypothetical protein
MSEIAIHLDEGTTRRLEEESRREGISPAVWVEKTVRAHFEERLPDSFFAVLGTWEDDREPEEILRDIRADTPQRERVQIR